jgi:predicted membrane channel-forming protein YqfA (hemolysin III family)
MDVTDSIRLVSGVVLISVGVPLFYLARYLLAPEEKKKRIALSLKVISIVWMSVGVIFYLIVLLTHIF